MIFQNLTDIVALVESDSGESDNVELKGVDSDAPPAWADALEETQYILSRLRVKIDSLVELHSKQLTRPTLDDTSQVRKFFMLQFGFLSYQDSNKLFYLVPLCKRRMHWLSEMFTVHNNCNARI